MKLKSASLLCCGLWISLVAQMNAATTRYLVRYESSTPVISCTPGQATKEERMNVVSARDNFEAELSALSSVENVSARTLYDNIPYATVELLGGSKKMLLNLPGVVSVELEASGVDLLNGTREQIQVPLAELYSANGANTAVAILDTGVQHNLPFFSGKLLAQACYSSSAGGVPGICQSAGSGLPCSSTPPYAAQTAGCGHGTHVAGVAVGGLANFNGVASAAKLIAINVNSLSGSGEQVTIGGNSVPLCMLQGVGAPPCRMIRSGDVLSALDQICTWNANSSFGSTKVAAVNMSFRLSVPVDVPLTYTGHCTNAAFGGLRSIIGSLRESGVSVIAASGNDGNLGLRNETYAPACIEGVIPVAASVKQSGTAELTGYSQVSSIVRLVAPGGDAEIGNGSQICSSVTDPVAATACVDGPSGNFGTASGTSQAAPHVAGAFAAMKGRFPQATVDQLYDALYATGASVAQPAGLPQSQIPPVLPLLRAINVGEAVASGTEPTNVSATATCGGVQLSWGAPALLVPSYYQYQSSTDGNFGTTWTSVGSGTSASIPNVTSSALQVRLRAGDTVGAGRFVTRVTTPPTNCPPTINGLTAPQTVVEDGVSDPIAFTISDPDTNVNLIGVTAVSNNPDLISSAGIVISGSGAARAITLAPIADANGSGSIVVTASDGTGNSSAKTVNVSVTPVNDAPSFNFRTGCKVNAGDWVPGSSPPTFRIRNGVSAVQTCGEFTDPVFGPANESHQYFALPAAEAVLIEDVSNSSLFFEQPNFTSAINQLRFSTTGLAGSADITIRIRDDGGTANEGIDLSTPRTFRVIVAHRPVITGLPTTTQTFLEDAPVGPLHFTIADADSDVNQLTVEAYGSDGFLQAQDGIVISGTGANRSIQISPVADFNGSAVLTVVVTDSDGNSESAEVAFDVTPVNDAPSFEFTEHCGMNAVWEPDGFPPALTLAPSTERPYACPDFTVPNFGPGKELDQSFAAPSSQAVQIISISDDSIFTIPPHFSGATNELLFKPNGTIGYADVVIRIRDNGGTEHGGVDLSETKSFRIRVGEPIGAVVDFTEVPGIPCSPAAVAWNPAVGYPDAAYEIEETCPVFNAPSITQVHSSFATSVAPYISEECNTVGGPVATYRVRACSSPSVCGPWSGSLHAVRPDGCYD